MIQIKAKFLFMLSFFTLQAYCQENVKMVTEYGSKNPEINSLMLFQNIEVEHLSFESPGIIGKFYEVNLKEYKKGKLVNTKNLFNLAAADFLKIDSVATAFTFFSKIEDDKLTVFIQSPHMYGEKKMFQLEKGKGSDYLLKDFQGEAPFKNVPLNAEFPILAVITPTQQKDGTSSYCEVAQSGVPSEKFWDQFGTPHYFVVTMKFKS